MRDPAPDPDAEARASLLAWARAKGIEVREDHGWIIIEKTGKESDPLLALIEDLLNGRA